MPETLSKQARGILESTQLEWFDLSNSIEFIVVLEILQNIGETLGISKEILKEILDFLETQRNLHERTTPPY